MKRYLSLSIALYASVFFVIVSCENETVCPAGTESSSYTIQLTVLADSIDCLPGDTTSVPVSIFVIGETGEPVAGQRVFVSLANTQLGFLQFGNLDLGDTTDSQGYVSCTYLAFSEQGEQRFQVCTAGDCDQAFLTQTVIDTTPTVHVYAYHFPEYFNMCPGELDSVYVSASLTDWNGSPIRGVAVQLSTSMMGGFQSIPPTDYNGFTRTRIDFIEQYGEFWFAGTYGGVSDTVYFEIQEYDGPPETFTIRAPEYSDSNHVILPPNSNVDIAVTIIMYHVPPQAGWPVQLHGTLGGIPSLGQTDSLGVAHFNIHTGTGGSGYFYGGGQLLCSVQFDTLFYTVSP